MRSTWMALGIVIALSLTACQKKNALKDVQSEEDKAKATPMGRAIYSTAFGQRSGDPAALTNNNFSNYNPNGFFAGGNSGYSANPFENPVAFKLDSFMPNLTSVPTPQWPFIRRCDPSRFTMEKQMVLEVATRSRLYPHLYGYKKYIPVRYAVAVGTAADEAANQSHRRTILRRDYDGHSYIPVGAANTTGPTGGHFYYDVNATGARHDFINGFMCFFNLVPVTTEVVGQVPIPVGSGYNAHNWHYMHYGGTYTSAADLADVATGLKASRLFNKIENENVLLAPPQIVPIYVADFRQEITDPDNNNVAVPILRAENINQLPRMYELTSPGRKIFNLPNIWKHRDRVTQVLSLDRTLGGWPVKGYEGVPQLLDWLAYSGTAGTVIAASYTPIVLDLGARGIITSSDRHGTFFNTGMYRNFADSNPATMYDVRYQTAWLGGEIENTGLINSVAPHYRPTMKDGFLVLPDANGLVKDARNLLGQFTPVTVLGSTTTYSNGYQALAAMTNKNCSVQSGDPKATFLGPWDPMYYTLKIWIDKDRNGHVHTSAVASHSERKELYTLAEAGVAAINVCKLYDRQEFDQYGNDTSMRSAFLYMPGETIIGNEAEILNRLYTGQTAYGAAAEFRVTVDIRFRANPANYLDNVESSNYGR